MGTFDESGFRSRLLRSDLGDFCYYELLRYFFVEAFFCREWRSSVGGGEIACVGMELLAGHVTACHHNSIYLKTKKITFFIMLSIASFKASKKSALYNFILCETSSFETSKNKSND